MIRLNQQEQDKSVIQEDIDIPHHHQHRDNGRIIETDYLCGCRSHDPHAPERCQIHGDAIRLTRNCQYRCPTIHMMFRREGILVPHFHQFSVTSIHLKWKEQGNAMSSAVYNAHEGLCARKGY